MVTPINKSVFGESSSSSSEGDKKLKDSKFSAVASAALVRAQKEPHKEEESTLDEYSSEKLDLPDPAPRKSRYIEKLVQRAKERKEETRIAADRRLAKASFGEQEHFVTAAYQRTLIGEGTTPTPAAQRRHEKRDFEGKPHTDPPAEVDHAKLRPRKRSRFGDKPGGQSSHITRIPEVPNSYQAERKKLLPKRRNSLEEIEKYRERYYLRKAERAKSAETN